MSGPIATSAQERFVRIPTAGEELVGVVTEPTVEPRNVAVILLSGRSGVSSVGRSRLFVFLARQLAAQGYHSIRFDYQGVGESTGDEQPWELAAPFLEDAKAVVGWLEAEGFTDIRTMGTCGGARLALHVAPDTAAASGVAMFSPIVRNYHKSEREETLPTSELARRALRKETVANMRDKHTRQRYLRVARRRLQRLLRRGPRPAAGAGAFQWVSANVVDDLERLIDKQVPVMLFFGSDDSGLEDWKRGIASGRLAELLGRAGDLVTLEVVEGRYHALPAMEAQPAVLGALERWLAATSENTVGTQSS